MTMACSDIQALILHGLPKACVDVTTEDHHHFQALVVCPSFSGLSMLQQHRLVYDTLGSKMGNEIHALALTTRTPE